jgi:hypothetical protein
MCGAKKNRAYTAHLPRILRNKYVFSVRSPVYYCNFELYNFSRIA